ncbi:hypothetical protein QYM18_06305 [Ectopseudomonas chengduensis]|nr:hypothetical protein [Pseudomonas chengduensis]WKC38696.1 hypothetical protein QYM18_06305 [Pseudomonas chengduensis]
MNKLNDRAILFSSTYLVAWKEALHLDIPVAEEIFPITIEFDEQELDDRSPVTWRTEDGRFFLKFHGLKEHSGLRIIQSPVKIGSIGEAPLSLMASVQRHFKAFQIHLQFMSGGQCL